MSDHDELEPRKQGRWNLKCVGIFNETHNVKTFHFTTVSILHGETIFLHKPGQFVALQFLCGDQKISRTYTVSSPPSRPATVSLTIKRDPMGLVSRFMHDHVSAGDVVPAIGPAGEFNIRDINPRQKLLLLSGGSGITPGMSVLREIYDTVNTDVDVVFLHSARTPEDIIFRNELAWMSSERSNIHVGYICEADAESGMDKGFLTPDKLQSRVPDVLERTVMTCGPAPYMDAVKAMLHDAGFDMARHHEESFGDPSLRDNPDGASPDTLRFANPFDPDNVEETPAHYKQDIQEAPEYEDAEYIVSFLQSGQDLHYEPGETLLSVASRAGIAIPTNCQMGICGTCKVRLESGEVIMEDDEGLTHEDKVEGYILTCCGRANGPVKLHL